ncbi:MAG: hypothetical protein AAGF72_05195 [Pseudomonadota bacterium]
MKTNYLTSRRTGCRLWPGTAAVFALCACSSGGGNGSAGPIVDIAPPPVATPPSDDARYTVLTTRTLDADGDQVGLDTYDLIRAFGGPNPIESPDLYPVNHPDVRHIVEDTDATVGNHFVFKIHRDIDIDRDRVANDDRQRNEIKTYSSSSDDVKGFENETFVYRWKFRINASMEVSRRFTHLFQLKAVGGDDSQPILTISGAERSGEDGIEVRHSPLQRDTILQRQSWDLVTGEWLEAYCRATFSESGDLRLIVTRMSDNRVIFDINEQGLDLWRGTDPSHFVRPKWGIYRSILDGDNLRADEETVRFANFSVSEVLLNN